MSGYRWRFTIYNERGAYEAGLMVLLGGICVLECVVWSLDGFLFVVCL